MIGKVKILDGAFGSYKQESGLSSLEIYKNYIKAGVDYLTINGFDLIFENYEESALVVQKETEWAIQAKQELNSDVTLLGSIGPTNILLSMKPNRAEMFGLLVSYYKSIAFQYLKTYQVKSFIIETAQDALNIKAALKALYELNSQYIIDEVFVSCVPDESGYLLDGTHFMAVHNNCKNYPFIKAFGFNCGRGPAGYEELLFQLNQDTNLPIIFYPNAGIPHNGRYQTPKEFGRELGYIERGNLKVNVLGGCCGTTPEHIKVLKSWKLSAFHNFHKPREHKLEVIGERLNANGSKKFLKAAQMGSIFEISEIIGDQEPNSVALDVNVDNPLIENKLGVYQVVLNNTKLDICIDTSDSSLRREFQSITPHHTIVNSLALSDPQFDTEMVESMKYGSDIIIRAQHPKLKFGKNLEEKIQIAQESLNPYWNYSGVLYDICLTPICLDESSDDRIRDFKNLAVYLKTVYPDVRLCAGISNISFAFKGNPSFRKLLNTVFAEWLRLDVVIGNPEQFANRYNQQYAPELRRLLNQCMTGKSITQDLLEMSLKFDTEVPKLNTSKTPQLYEVLLAGDPAKAASMVSDKPIDDLTEAITKVSELYDGGKLQIIQMLVASDTLKKTFKYLPIVPDAPKYYGILCTVRGDIHDIGKDIVKEVITAQGVQVTDLGIDIDSQKILNELFKRNYDFVGLSGLISPSLHQMELICEELDAMYRKPLVVFLGGAVLYQAWVDSLQRKLKHITVKYAKTPIDLLAKL